jgi:N-acetyl-gamma-glutamylphosphate reductase
MAEKLKTAVLGATGYSGVELARLLSRHPLVDQPLLLRRGAAGDDAGTAMATPRLRPSHGTPCSNRE